METKASHRCSSYVVGPQNNWNLNVAREIEQLVRCAARYREQL
jgi:hypothetical protein